MLFTKTEEIAYFFARESKFLEILLKYLSNLECHSLKLKKYIHFFARESKVRSKKKKGH